MLNKLRIVFMGTPDFAVGSLKALIEEGQNIVGVITAPDKPAGRGQNILSSPVKTFAIHAGIKRILQPESLKSTEFIDELKSLRADLYVVVAFRMLPETVWSIPPKGTINLHASLLPDYRGAAPINWTIMNGEVETGVTTFFIDKEIDTGKIIYREKVAIGPDTTAGELHDQLMSVGAQLLVKTIDSIADGTNPNILQNEFIDNKKLQLAPKIYKEDCRIDWKWDGQTIYNFIRGLSPYPAAWTEICKAGEPPITLKIFEAGFETANHMDDIGKIMIKGKESLKIAIQDGFIRINNLQQAGKKRMNINEFMRGFQNIEDFLLVI